MNINLGAILTTILAPVINFLKDKGLWDTLVKIYEIISGVVINLWNWLNANADLKKIVDLAVPFLKFVLNVFLTFLDVLSRIINWVLGLFK